MLESQASEKAGRDERRPMNRWISRDNKQEAMKPYKVGTYRTFSSFLLKHVTHLADCPSILMF